MPDSLQTLTAMIYDYCELFDTGDFEGFAKQFEHGVWHRAEPGADAVRRWIADHVVVYEDGLPCTKHVTTNLVVEVDEQGGTANARSYVIVFQARPDFPMQPIFGGRYRDRFERVDGEWRWLERRVLSDLRGDTSHHTH